MKEFALQNPGYMLLIVFFVCVAATEIAQAIFNRNRPKGD